MNKHKQEFIDKQALIDELMKIPGVGSNSDALETIKRFPSYKPQKPVVPKFVAEWFEENRYALDLAIFIAIRGLDEEEWPHKTDFENWLDVSKNKPIETLIRMKDGYEVEKEPLWAIKNADGNYLTKCALWGKDGVNYSFECNPSHRLLFTDKATANAAALLVNGTVEEVVEE